MEEKQDIKQLVSLIIEQEFSEESMAYGAIEAHSADRLFDTGLSSQWLQKNEAGFNEFADEVGEILKAIGVLASTIKTFLEIRKILNEGKKASTADLESKWRAELISNGIAIEKADEIVAKYHKDLEKIVH